MSSVHVIVLCALVVLCSFDRQVEVDNSGYVNIDKLQQTNVEGVSRHKNIHQYHQYQ